MKFRLQHWLLFFCIASLWSCEEEVFFSHDEFKPRIILNAIFTNDSTWVINLSHSQSVFDQSGDKPFIEDAKIVITNRLGEQECKLFHTGNGVYKSYKCTSGQEQYYKIAVYSPTYGSVTAESTIPAVAELTDIQVVNSDEFEDASEISFNIKDISEQDNYYIWSVIEVDTTLHPANSSGSLKLDTRQWLSDVSKEVGSNSTNKFQVSTSASEFDLENLASSPKIITSRFAASGGTQGGNNSIKNKVLMIRLMTVSSDLYNYYQSMQAYIKASPNQNSVVDPSRLFTNVKGGLGIFGGYSVKFYEIPK